MSTPSPASHRPPTPPPPPFLHGRLAPVDGARCCGCCWRSLSDSWRLHWSGRTATMGSIAPGRPHLHGRRTGLRAAADAAAGRRARCQRPGASTRRRRRRRGTPATGGGTETTTAAGRRPSAAAAPSAPMSSTTRPEPIAGSTPAPRYPAAGVAPRRTRQRGGSRGDRSRRRADIRQPRRRQRFAIARSRRAGRGADNGASTRRRQTVNPRSAPSPCRSSSIPTDASRPGRGDSPRRHAGVGAVRLATSLAASARRLRTASACGVAWPAISTQINRAFRARAIPFPPPWPRPRNPGTT